MANFDEMNVTFNPNFNASIQMQPAPVVNLQESKTATPTKESQRVIPDAEYDGLRAVIINPIPDRYIEPDKVINITQNGTHNVTDAKEVNIDVPVPPEYIIPNGTKDITKNGEVDVTEYKTANVNIPERKEEQEATVNITKNGTTEIFPDENKVLSKATVNVNVPIPDGYIKPEGSMDITENGTFDVMEKAEVKVNVPTSALKISQVENMLILR